MAGLRARSGPPGGPPVEVVTSVMPQAEGEALLSALSARPGLARGSPALLAVTLGAVH